MEIWTVTCIPTSFDGVRGLAVLITDGEDREEVGRVAFVRSQSENPDVSFEDQLDKILERADRAADTVNELAAELERLRREADREQEERENAALEETRRKLREALGSAKSRAKASMA